MGEETERREHVVNKANQRGGDFSRGRVLQKRQGRQAEKGKRGSRLSGFSWGRLPGHSHLGKRYYEDPNSVSQPSHPAQGLEPLLAWSTPRIIKALKDFFSMRTVSDS